MSVRLVPEKDIPLRNQAHPRWNALAYDRLVDRLAPSPWSLPRERARATCRPTPPQPGIEIQVSRAAANSAPFAEWSAVPA